MAEQKYNPDTMARLRELLVQQEDLQEQLAALTGRLTSEVTTLDHSNGEAGGVPHGSLAPRQAVNLLGRLAVAPTESDAVEVIVSAARQFLPCTHGALSLAGESAELAVVGVWDVEEQWNRPYRNSANPATPPQRLAQRVSAGPTGEAITFTVRGFGLRLGELRVWPEGDGCPEPEELDARGELIARAAGMVLGGMALQRKLHHHTVRDPLTGLFNRRYLMDTLARELHRAIRHGTPLGLMVLDIDHFSLFNDRYGHDDGNRMLQAIAGVMDSKFRSSDLCARTSGERFAIVLPEASLADTRQRAEWLRQEIAGLRLTRGEELLDAVTVSIGVAAIAEHGKHADDLIAAAESAILLARQDGGNAVRAIG